MKGEITKDELITQELSKYRKYCKCGHSVIIPDGTDVGKVICTHCGHYIYKNEKEKFKDILRRKINGKR